MGERPERLGEAMEGGVAVAEKLPLGLSCEATFFLNIKAARMMTLSKDIA